MSWTDSTEAIANTRDSSMKSAGSSRSPERTAKKFLRARSRRSSANPACPGSCSIRRRRALQIEIRNPGTGRRRRRDRRGGSTSPTRTALAREHDAPEDATVPRPATQTAFQGIIVWPRSGILPHREKKGRRPKCQDRHRQRATNRLGRMRSIETRGSCQRSIVVARRYYRKREISQPSILVQNI